MAGFAASGALGLGAGAAMYNFGLQGQYKEDISIASAAACAVFVGLAAAQQMLGGGEATGTTANANDTKKKKKKAKKVSESEEDSDSTTEKPKAKPKADAPAKTSKSEQPLKIKVKEEKKETKPEPNKKGDKQKAKVEPPKSATEEKANNKNAGKDAKKGETVKNVKKGEAPKAGKDAAQKPKKVVVDSDSDDEEAFLRLGQKNTGLVPSRAAVVTQDSDEDDDADDGPAKAEPSNSKSAIRRRKAKENKEKAVAAAAETTKPKKATVDKDGFETVPITKRPAKKPSTTPAAGSIEAKAEKKAPEATTFSDTIELESKQMALLIGPKGETLTSLRDACGGVKIDTPARDSGDKKVTISGAEDLVKYCKIQIRDLTTKGYCAALSPGITSSNMKVSGPALGSLIGPGGSNIKKIQTEFDVKIKTPDRGSTSEQITISGSKDNVKKAKSCIQQLIEHGFSNVTHEGFEVGEVPFPRSELRHLIGPGGQTIKSIQGDTKTKVKIPAEDSENQNVQVIGPAVGVARAIKQISTLLERKAAKEAAAADAASYDSEDDA
jgi:chemotaxis protein histidine kinase CheA